MKYAIVHPNKIPAPGIVPSTITMHYVDHSDMSMASDTKLENATMFSTYEEAEATLRDLHKHAMNRDLIFTIMRVE